MNECRLILGDCLDVLPTLEAGSVDAVVTDPPAGIGFMGKEWDSFGSRRNGKGQAHRDAYRDSDPNRGNADSRPRYAFQGGAGLSRKDRDAFVAFLTAALAECLRVAKPGARLLCWAIPRTSHWTGTAVEDAGWVIEDRISHLFGQGFPKAKSKLKPACEDWWLARKPSRGVPALPGLDACRVEGAPRNPGFRNPTPGGRPMMATGNEKKVGYESPAGRWPANVVLSHTPECRLVGTKRVRASRLDQFIDRAKSKSESIGEQTGSHCNGYADADGRETVESWECHPDCPVRLLDGQSGGRCGAHGRSGKEYGPKPMFSGPMRGTATEIERDSGGASRFFYCAKASRADRGDGNTHPTVKPVALMRWLCRLIALPGGTVLDPFAGSGSTGKAALAEGFGFVGIERDPTYHAIATKRLAAVQPPLLTA